MGKPVNILLIEDSADEAHLVEIALKRNKSPFQLRIVNNGEKALDYLYGRDAYKDAVRPDLILLDLNMPRKSGLQVLSEIKSNPAFLAIPIIILTTSESEDDIAASYKLHANGYVVKPVDLDRFIEIIKSIEDFWFMTASLPPRNDRETVEYARSDNRCG